MNSIICPNCGSVELIFHNCSVCGLGLYDKEYPLAEFLEELESPNQKGATMENQKLNREETLEQVRQRYPEAENDIVAVDLAAQELWKSIQKSAESLSREELQPEIDRYYHLNWLRSSLLNKAVSEQSDFMVKEAEQDIKNLKRVNLES